MKHRTGQPLYQIYHALSSVKIEFVQLKQELFMHAYYIYIVYISMSFGFPLSYTYTSVKLIVTINLAYFDIK